MIAADTSVWIDFFDTNSGKESQALESALIEGRITVPTPVYFELMSAPGITSKTAQIFEELPRLEISDGFWTRAAELRRKILLENKKARSMDCLIVQNCLDHKVALIARDKDFRHFLSHGLRLWH